MRATRDGWKAFFSALPPDLNTFFATPQESAKHVRAILQTTRMPRGSRVLDLACGIGRHSLALARAGMHVVGLDYSETYVAEARRLAKRESMSGSVEFVRRDMRELASVVAPGTFDLVLMINNGFGYFDDRRDDARVVIEVARALKPSGRFLLGVQNITAFTAMMPPAHDGVQTMQLWSEVENNVFSLWTMEWNQRRGRGITRSVIIDSRGKRPAVMRQTLGQSGYTDKDIRKLLPRCGFEIVSLRSSCDGDPFDRARSMEMVWLCRKGGRSTRSRARS
jgi:SAM-dependent methyltransferase